ncbi:hypothetical protein F8M41_002904 [Gigaspora margarita]|uniref:Uncharacterized protein n=1 Tax=Gigaspora margarita TaxID=4874 RepID=A0A8H4A8V8_GIGMA|nr:hypothetical protein F8M41_002904 [Gigaspora margarita]
MFKTLLQCLENQNRKSFLSGPLDAICGTSVVYLAMGGNNVGSYEEVKNLANSAINSALKKIVDNDRKEQVSKDMPEVSVILKIFCICYYMMKIQQMSMEVTAEGWGGDDLEERYLWERLETSKMRVAYKSVVGLRLIKALNMDNKEATSDQQQEEIKKKL